MRYDRKRDERGGEGDVQHRAPGQTGALGLCSEDAERLQTELLWRLFVGVFLTFYECCEAPEMFGGPQNISF